MGLSFVLKLDQDLIRRCIVSRPVPRRLVVSPQQQQQLHMQVD